MSISLREITPENFYQCIELKVADSQARFVASNLMSIAQARIYPTLTPLAIYAGDELVGLVMYGFFPDDGRYYLRRIMIDERHQGKGYGRAAILEVIERMKMTGDCREVYLSFVPGNDDAERLYRKIGFERTGEISRVGEIMMRYPLRPE